MAEYIYEHDEITGIASRGTCSVIHLSKCMMNREVGFGRRLLQILEEEQLSLEHAPSGIDNMSVIVDSALLTTEKERHMLSRIETELGADEVTVEHGLSLITITGQNVRYGVGLAAKACGALAEAGVNIEMIDHGSSEISLIFGVKKVDRQRAVQALDRALLGIEKPH